MYNSGLTQIELNGASPFHFDVNEPVSYISKLYGLKLVLKLSLSMQCDI